LTEVATIAGEKTASLADASLLHRQKAAKIAVN
jgi:hypothetical protein